MQAAIDIRFPRGFRPALAVSAVLSVLGAAAALAVTRRRRPAPAQQPAQPAAQHPAEPLSLTG